jgi:hypothetical protein
MPTQMFPRQQQHVPLRRELGGFLSHSDGASRLATMLLAWPRTVLVLRRGPAIITDHGSGGEMLNRSVPMPLDTRYAGKRRPEFAAVSERSGQKRSIRGVHRLPWSLKAGK